MCSYTQKKGRRKEEIFLFQKQKRRGRKKMLFEVESLTAFPPKYFKSLGSIGSTTILFN